MAIPCRVMAAGLRLTPKTPIPSFRTQYRTKSFVRAGQKRWLSQQRHGTAVEPTPLEQMESEASVEGDNGSDGTTEQVPKTTNTQAAVKTEKENQSPTEGLDGQEERRNANSKALGLLPQEIASPSNSGKKNETKPTAFVGRLASPTASRPPSTSTKDAKEGSSRTPEEERARQLKQQARQSGPLEAIMTSPSPDKANKTHPSMSPSKYVHHFDSYSLVKQLEEGGYTKGQSITAMKGVRALLAQNLDVAQESLVSKSDVENETYLFRAACSELATEIHNNRRIQDESVRQQRTHLQHEVDIVAQTLNQELTTLSDNVRGMFNDRRMTVREEQKSMDSAVQQITYKISTSLAGESKSEIEGVRWILIRRAVLGIIFMAFLAISTVRYATWLSQERAREAKRMADEEERRRLDGGKSDNSSPMDAAAILTAN